MIFIILLSIAAGASIVISRNINAMLAIRIGLWQGTFFNYMTGLILSILFWGISGETISLSDDFFLSVPLYAYLGGLLGLMVVVISNIVIPKISAFYMTLIVFIGQLFTGIIMDYFTLDVISAGKVIGGLLVIIGLSYNLHIDRKTISAKN